MNKFDISEKDTLALKGSFYKINLGQPILTYPILNLSTNQVLFYNEYEKVFSKNVKTVNTKFTTYLILNLEHLKTVKNTNVLRMFNNSILHIIKL